MVSSVTNMGANASRRYIEINSGRAGKATEELASGLVASNPSYDPSSSAVGYRLTSNIESLLQAGRNVSQATSLIQMATGFLGATNDVLTRMKKITVAANTDTVGDSERKMLDAEYQTLLDQVNKNANNARWGGVSLFTGGGGTATARTPLLAAETATGGGAATATFAVVGTSFVAASSQGMIDGVATAATVTQNGSLYEVSITVGNQTFKGTTAGLVASPTILMTSTTDSGNIIAMDMLANFADAATAQTNLRQVLGINSGTAAVFTSVNTAVAMPGVTSFTAGGGTNAGAWGVTYTQNSATQGTFKITRGSEYYTATVTPANAITGAVTFSNGAVLNLTNFDGDSGNVAQHIYDVTQGTAITQNFQYAEKSTDTLSVIFRGANLSALGLTGTNVLTTTAAASASALIDLAQQSINVQIGELGGKASQFKFMSDTIRVNVQNSQAARATFTDADVAQSMQDLQTYNGLQQIAQSVFGKALNDLSNLVSMVQSVR